MPVEAFDLSDVDTLAHVESEEVPPLMIVAGPNGVGKSTLFENLAMEIDPSSSSESGVSVETVGQVQPVYFSPHRAPTPVDISEKLFQTYTMRIGRFHETWNGSQPSAERWLTTYSYYYNHLRSHQALDNQPPLTAAGLS